MAIRRSKKPLLKKQSLTRSSDARREALRQESLQALRRAASVPLVEGILQRNPRFLVAADAECLGNDEIGT